MNDQTRPKLPRRGKKREAHGFNLQIPLKLWNQMIVAGLGWGDVTGFIIEAIKEKLKREGGKV